MAHGGPKVQELSLLQLTGARCSIIYNPLSSNGHCLQHPTLLPCSCRTAQDQLPHPWWGAQLWLLQLSLSPSETPLWKWARATPDKKWRGTRSVQQPPLGQNLNASLLPLDWHNPNTECLFCWHTGLSLLPSHIFFRLGYNRHLHSTYYNILQQ